MKRSSLLFKLMGAFLLVTIIGTLVISVLVSHATQNAFSLYTTKNSQILARRLSKKLADYYALNNSWEGVDQWMELDSIDLPINGMNGMGMGHGRGQGQQNQSSGESQMMEQRLILADAEGKVLFDSSSELTGSQLSSSELSTGESIMNNDSQIGTIILGKDTMMTPDSPANEFITSANRAIISSSIIAGIIAILLGGLLFFEITSPIRKLKQASARISSGDLSQRVEIKSHDEFGDLGETFNQMAENLDKTETARRNLVADIAHELRTPLTAIQGTLEGIQDEVLPLNQEQISVLYSETVLLNRLVSDLRLLSLADAGQLKLEKTLLYPDSLIQEAVESFKPQANQKNIHLQINIKESLPLVKIDSDRITQVINNLISNALHYIPPNGTILVECRPEHEKKLLTVQVGDSGPGIDPSDLSFVFDRFYRADKSRSRISGGSGLGLSIVKQIIEAHGGIVQAISPNPNLENSSYPGTLIVFTLPAEE